MKVLVTGATGFVGINTVNYLKEECDVVAFVRNREKAIRFLGKDIEIKMGRIEDLESVRKALKGVDVVLHIAGLINAFDLEKLYDVNRLGCRNIAIASREANIGNILYLSSLAARGPDGYKAPVSHYGVSKRLGELELIKLLFDRNLKILRPPIIYGPYDRGMFEFFKMASLGFLPRLNKVYSMIYIDDLVVALRELMNLNLKRPKVYYVTGGTYTSSEIAGALFKAVEKKGFTFPVYNWFVSVASLIGVGKSPFSRDKAREIKPKAWTCSNEAIYDDIGFIPKIDLIEGVKKTYKWYVDNGWL